MQTLMCQIDKNGGEIIRLSLTVNFLVLSILLSIVSATPADVVNNATQFKARDVLDLTDPIVLSQMGVIMDINAPNTSVMDMGQRDKPLLSQLEIKMSIIAPLRPGLDLRRRDPSLFNNMVFRKENVFQGGHFARFKMPSRSLISLPIFAK
jgi:hypothetical protein